MHDIPQLVIGTIKATILVVAALFPIVNPIGSAAIFVNMVGGAHTALHKVLARKIAVYSFFLLLGSMLFGAKVLLFFGVSLYAVQLGGGLIVASTGWSLLNQSGAGAATDEEPVEEKTLLANAFYPYTLPITVGPGSISVAVTLGAHLPAELNARSFLSPTVLLASVLGIVIVCFIILLCYSYAGVAERRLGETGTSVLMRLSSFILLCIGVQIFCTGAIAFVGTFR